MSNEPRQRSPVRTPRAVRWAAAVLACAVAFTGALDPLDAEDGSSYRGRRLVEVLEELKDRGLDLVFSSAVVRTDLRVTVEPAAVAPRAILDAILPPLGLRATDGPGGTVLILPGPPPEDEPAKGPASRPAFITEVVVTPNRHSVANQEQASRHTVNNDEVILAPTTGGEITRVVELLPGVTTADSSAALNIRGSLAQDVSLVLDGLELYEPFHLQSFQSPFSLIDSNVVDRIDFFGGGFTADLGDRHGGFIKIATFVPEQPARGDLELGTVNSRLTYRAPFSKGTGSWLLSARGWYPEALLNTTQLGGGEDLDPRFGDVYVKAGFQLDSRHRLSVHGLLAYDRLRYTETGEEVNERVNHRSRSGYLWLRGLSAWFDNFTSETLVSGGRIERLRGGISSQRDSEILVDDDRKVDFVGFRHDSVWQISDSHALKFGGDLRSLDARYQYSAEDTADPAASLSLGLEPDGTSFGVYAAHRARISSKLSTELGFRWDRQTYTDDNQLSPRFNTVWRPGERSEMRLALGRFQQSQRIHELHVEDGETSFRRAEVSEQAELSFQHRFRSGLRVRVDAYHRELSKLRPRFENLFEPVELFPETAEDRVRIEPEEARLRGVEFLIRGEADRPLVWWASYALSSADDIIDGREIPRSWDQTHSGKFLIGYRRDDRWSVSLSGSAHTGWPTTPVLPQVTTLPDGSIEIEPVPGERNSDRYASSFRLDLKARWAVPVSRGRLWLGVEVINLTDRENPCCLNEVHFNTGPDGTIDVLRDFDYWLGIRPSFSFLWEF